jgi:hypothetical protein
MVYVCQHILFRARRFSVATFDFPNFLFFFQTGKWFGKESGILIGKKKLKIAEKNQSIENAPDPGGLIDEQGHLQPRQNRQACTRSILYCHQRYLLKGREFLRSLVRINRPDSNWASTETIMVKIRTALPYFFSFNFVLSSKIFKEKDIL